MASDDPETLVSPSWLAKNIRNPDIRVIDASWHMPSTGRDARAEYEVAHIPGAGFFDIDEISDRDDALPHMAAPASRFASRVKALGVGDGHQIVIYDSVGLFSAARVWWNLRLMGKSGVAVLDGGLPKWRAEGHPVEDIAPVPRHRHLTVRMQNSMVRTAAQVAEVTEAGTHCVIDARSAERFSGILPEPRAGLRQGHIPRSCNVPYASLLNADGTMKPPDALREVFETAGVDLAKPAITTCGSGVTAAIVSLALERMGKTDHALYDGSWAEWGQLDSMPVATGEREC